MQWLRRLSVLRTAVHPPRARPAYAPLIEHSASFALGDLARGRAMAARAMLESHDEGDAIRSLLRMLPTRTATWPIARTPDGPASLQNRVLAIARSWQPSTRFVLAVYVLGNVERHDLNQYAGTRAADRVADCIGEIAHALDLLRSAGTSSGCKSVADRLLDADHPEHGRAVRLHAVGCATCRDRIAGLQTAVRLLRTAIEQHFAPPTDVGAVTVAHPSRRSFQWTNTARLATLLIAIVTLLVVVTGQVAPSQTASTPMIPAHVVLDRALTRFDAPQTDGVLHERYQLSGGLPLEVERYVDAEQHLRVSVTNTEEPQPLLVLVAAGQRLRYTVWSDGKWETHAFDNPRVRELMPLLRMLPEGGPVRSFPALHSGMDLDFLGTARRVGATLLGTTSVDGRSAYLLSYREPEQQQEIVLAIDAATYALLRASNTGTGERAQSEVLWEAKTVELLDEAPPRTFDMGSTAYEQGLPNPRHLMFGSFSNIPLDDVSSYYGLMPVPVTIPAGTTLSYLREDNRIGVMQLYEGPRSTVALITSAPPLPSVTLRKLSFRTGETYWDVLSDDGDVTHVEFIRNTDPTHRSHLYVWHATMSTAERRTWTESIITSIEWIAAGSDNPVGKRFEDVPSTATR